MLVERIYQTVLKETFVDAHPPKLKLCNWSENRFHEARHAPSELERM